MDSEENKMTIEEAKKLYEGKYLEVGTAEARQTKYLYVKEITDSTQFPGKFIFRGMEMTVLLEDNFDMENPISGRVIFGKDFVLNLDMHNMIGQQITITQIPKERFAGYYRAATGNFLNVEEMDAVEPMEKVTNMRDALPIIQKYLDDYGVDGAGEKFKEMMKAANHRYLEMQLKAKTNDE